MNKIVSIFISFVLIFLLTACSALSSPPKDKPTSSKQTKELPKKRSDEATIQQLKSVSSFVFQTASKIQHKYDALQARYSAEGTKIQSVLEDAAVGKRVSSARLGEFNTTFA
ncbi:hypothetical protein [Shimazuella kribbensis]|uniref:hypothetical protein n=1 Tax=Shimazuella kribbensis TaxID=139808 RepID=UPI000400E29F|nr:hypothetical protein [Shimazuella kribbensis]